MTTPEAKKARQEKEGSLDETESLNTSDRSSVIMYQQTNVDQVYEASAFDTLKRAREDLHDEENPIVIVVTKSTRNAFLKFLSNFDGTNQQTTTATTNQNDQNINKDTFDMPLAEGIKRAYGNIIDDFNRETKKFPESELKNDLPEGTDINSFKEVRKNLSIMHAHCSRTMRLIDRIKGGKSPNLYTAEGNFDQNYTDTRTKMIADSRLRNSMRDINSWLANEMVQKCDPVISNGRGILQTIDPIIYAKAWRCIQKNKDIAPEWRQNIWGSKAPGNKQRPSFRQQRQDDRENTQNYNRDRQNYRDHERQGYTHQDTRREPRRDFYPRQDREYRQQPRRHDSDTDQYDGPPKMPHRRTDPDYPKYKQREDKYDFDRRPYRRQNPSYRRTYVDRHDENRRPDYYYRTDSRRHSYRYDEREFPRLNDSDSDHDEVFHRPIRPRPTRRPQ